MDYAALRAEAVESLGKLAGSQWTDHNVHDPGITILEQLCYAITELAYRTDFPIADLIATGGADPWPPTGDAILQGDPVTEADLQALLRAMGPEVLRIAPLEGMGIPLYFHERDANSGTGELRLDPPSNDPNAQLLRLRGVRQVLLKPSTIRRAVTDRLHGIRLLGEDVVVAELKPFKVLVTADLEVEAVDDPEAFVVAIHECLRLAITPDPGLATADGVRSSDLLHALLDLPRVRAVRSLTLAPSTRPQEREPWVLPIPPGEAAELDLDSPINLYRNGLLVRANRTVVLSRLQHNAGSERRSQPASVVSKGRRRDLKTFRSLRRQLPAAYGVGPDGLGSAASPERRAQALQLQAYLLIFDQLLSNALAQLAFAPELLSPAAGAASGPARSYASRPVEDPPLRFGELIDLPATEYATKLQDWVEPGVPSERRQRFLAHLLARFGEELSSAPGDRLLALRREFLADIGRMTGARGSGVNILDGAAVLGGFEERLRRKLGLPLPESTQVPPFLVIEHILLRPLPEDAGQAADEGELPIPFLTRAPSADPWSLQVSLVMNQALYSVDFESVDFESRVAQTFVAELPAHLTPRLLWFGDGGSAQEEPKLWQRTLEAWRQFRKLHAAYRKAADSAQAIKPLQQLACRDARDRVIELLQLGLPWPLRDIPMPAELVVTQGSSAAITLGFSQQGVRYELWDRDTGFHARLHHS